MHKTLIALLIATSLSIVHAETETANQPETETMSFYEDSERGWFWYEQLPEEEKEEIRKKILEQQPTITPSPKPSKSEEKLKPLSTKWFNVYFEQYKNAAIDNPYDKEAMRTYLYLEKFMRDRATAFAYERQKAVYEDPFLDSSTQRPTANFGMKAMSIDGSKVRDALLDKIGSESGIFFFYRSDCHYCEMQAPLVKGLQREYGFEVKLISLDGKEMKKPLWDEFMVNEGQAEALEVHQVPALYVFNPKENAIELISQGLQSLPELKKRIIAASERAQLITTEEADQTRGTGLYQTTSGDVSNGFPLTEDAPETFKRFYFESIQQNQE